MTVDDEELKKQLMKWVKICEQLQKELHNLTTGRCGTSNPITKNILEEYQKLEKELNAAKAKKLEIWKKVVSINQNN